MVTNNGEAGNQEVTKAEVYNLHIRIARDMQDRLGKAALLAYKMHLITKPELTELMNLFIELGMKILEIRWVNKMRAR